MQANGWMPFSQKVDAQQGQTGSTINFNFDDIAGLTDAGKNYVVTHIGVRFGRGNLTLTIPATANAGYVTPFTIWNALQKINLELSPASPPSRNECQGPGHQIMKSCPGFIAADAMSKWSNAPILKIDNDATNGLGLVDNEAFFATSTLGSAEPLRAVKQVQRFKGWPYQQGPVGKADANNPVVWGTDCQVEFLWPIGIKEGEDIADTAVPSAWVHGKFSGGNIQPASSGHLSFFLNDETDNGIVVAFAVGIIELWVYGFSYKQGKVPNPSPPVVRFARAPGNGVGFDLDPGYHIATALTVNDKIGIGPLTALYATQVLSVASITVTQNGESSSETEYRDYLHSRFISTANAAQYGYSEYNFWTIPTSEQDPLIPNLLTDIHARLGMIWINLPGPKITESMRFVQRGSCRVQNNGLSDPNPYLYQVVCPYRTQDHDSIAMAVCGLPDIPGKKVALIDAGTGLEIPKGDDAGFVPTVFEYVNAASA